VRPAKDGEQPGQLGLEAAVEAQVIALRAGDDRKGGHVGAKATGHRQGVAVGGHGQLHFVAGGLQDAGQDHDPLGLVVDLLLDEQDAQGELPLN